MLTKELLQCRIAGGNVRPLFVPVDDPELLEAASRMLQEYSLGEARTRGEISEAMEAAQLLMPEQAPVLRAMAKILEDQAQFSSAADLDYPAERRKVFLASAKAIRQGRPLHAPLAVMEKAELALPLLECGVLYGDLPENDTLVSCRPLSPRDLLNRVNLGYVQGLLLQAKSLEISLQDASVQKLRRLLGRVRFHRLMAQVQRCPMIAPPGGHCGGALPALAEGCGMETEGETTKRAETDAAAIPQALKLQVDGPCSVLSQPKCYGLELAQFFPAVCAMDHWRLRAKVRWKNAERNLVLDEQSGLWYPGSSGGFLPPEIELFRKGFAENAPAGWRMLEDCPFFEAGGRKGDVVIPDFAFRTPAGRIVYLELFHRWHITPLEERLRYLEEHWQEGVRAPETRLAIGVDGGVAGKEEIKRVLEGSRWFRKYGFTYRHYPTVAKVLPVLQELS